MDILSISDAVSALEYLHRRSLLCDKCGDKLGEYRNQFNVRCKGCRAPHAEYNPNAVPNELERSIVAAVLRWKDSTVQGGDGNPVPTAETG